MFTSTYKVDLALVLMSVMPVRCWIAHYNGNISKERVIKVTDWTNALIKNKSQHRKCYCSFLSTGLDSAPVPCRGHRGHKPWTLSAAQKMVFIPGTILHADSSSDTSLPQVSLTGAHVPENIDPRVTEAQTHPLRRDKAAIQGAPEQKRWFIHKRLEDGSPNWPALRASTAAAQALCGARRSWGVK